MTRHDVVTTLRPLVAGALSEAHPFWHVEDARDRFDVEVRLAIEDADPMGEILGGMDEAERAAFFRDLEETEREGPMPADELRRSLDEAIERGSPQIMDRM